MEKREALECVRRWMAEEELPFEELTLSQDAWRLKVKDAILVTEILQPANRPDMVVIAAGIDVPEEIRQRLGAMKASTRADLLWHLRLTLIQLGPDFRNIELPFAKRVEFTGIVYFDGLSKDHFMREWRTVRRTALLFMWTLTRAVGASPDNQPPTGMVH